MLSNERRDREPVGPAAPPAGPDGALPRAALVAVRPGGGRRSAGARGRRADDIRGRRAMSAIATLFAFVYRQARGLIGLAILVGLVSGAAGGAPGAVLNMADTPGRAAGAGGSCRAVAGLARAGRPLAADRRLRRPAVRDSGGAPGRAMGAGQARSGNAISAQVAAGGGTTRHPTVTP